MTPSNNQVRYAVQDRTTQRTEKVVSQHLTSVEHSIIKEEKKKIAQKSSRQPSGLYRPSSILSTDSTRSTLYEAGTMPPTKEDWQQ
ncbi:MAG TPA: hypothetical protein DCE42_11725 [Myxococcales bacterium]|nr:hypothetical protein [Deltaproteobacteria bacterium]HAA55419.1 hypothetical protein [Myxococcales bacterium]